MGKTDYINRFLENIIMKYKRKKLIVQTLNTLKSIVRFYIPLPQLKINKINRY